MTDKETKFVPLDTVDAQPSGAGAESEIEARGLPAHSEEAIALSFAARHAETLRFVAAQRRWLMFNGLRWEVDTKKKVINLVRFACRQTAREADAKLQRAIASEKTVKAVERLAQADQRLAGGPDDFDLNLLLLNTPAGAVDLTTGKMRSHRSDDFATRITAVAPGGEAPLWHAFLDRVTGGDHELKLYLQRFAGYALTGLTSEHVLVFLYGTGANGKSVFMSTIAGVLGDYHQTAPVATFTASRGERHPTELAGLRGARLVTATETEEGQRWDESKIKLTTGGDRISARLMGHDFSEYTPQFKLLIAGNHKPSVRRVDEAMRRRMHLVSLNVTIPAEERDKNLVERLRDEWPGILQWMIDGCLDWQHDGGLRPPEAVSAATAAYLEAEDVVAAWLHEACDIAPDGWVPVRILYYSWKTWCARNGEHPGSTKRFSQNLEARGYQPDRHNSGRGFRGISCHTADFSNAWHDPGTPSL